MKLYPEAARLYVNESGFIRTETSASTYLKVMRHCQNQFPGHLVDTFTTQDLATYCLMPPVNKVRPAPKTIAKRMGHMRGSFRWWRWRGLCDPDPAVDLPLVVQPGKFGVREHTWLTSAQVKDLYHSYDESDPYQRRDRLIVMLGLFTGLRLDAIANLTWDQFDRGFTTLSVCVKGSKWLRLPVMEQLQDELRAWRKLAWLDATAVIPSIKEAFNPALLKRQKNFIWDRPLGEAGVYAVVKKAGERLGVHLAPHDMRRSFAGWLEEEGLDLREIQGLMGHENISTTAGYLERNPARLARAAQGLRRAL